MAFIPYFGGVRVEMIFSQASQRVENVYHIEKVTGLAYTAPELLAACARFADWWKANVKSLVTEDASLIRIDAKALDSDSAPGVEFTTDLPVAGTNAFPGESNSVTVAVKWTTGLTGRSFRGRTYHIGLSAEQNDQSRLVPPTAANLRAAYFALIATVAGNSPAARLTVASYVSNGVPRVSAVATPIISCSVNEVLDSQRRRLPERGS